MTGRMARVRELVWARPEVCSITDFVGHLRNARNDISTLELEFGWEFTKTPATHGIARHLHYSLKKVGRIERAPRQAVQRRLITT
jgi:hypothetical protein